MATKGKAGMYDYSDIMTLVRHTLKKYADNVDETRVAVHGWSVGGYLSYLCATHGTGVAPDDDDKDNHCKPLGRPFHFKAAICGADVSDWDLMAMASDARSLSYELSGCMP